jgi:hypothetical protein
MGLLRRYQAESIAVKKKTSSKKGLMLWRWKTELFFGS